MTAVATVERETPKQAARRLANDAIRQGYEPQALHEYRDAAGAVLFWRVRLKHPDGSKWIRPMRLNGHGFELGEPPAPPQGRPLYRLHELAARPDEPAIIVEGEACVDALAALGPLATTSGGADSAAKADWRPLAGRDVTIWPDNDAPGQRYALDVAERLHGLGCRVRLVDVAALDLPPKADAVDWLEQHPDATAADVLALPTAEPPATSADAAPVRTTTDEGHPRPQAAVLVDIGVRHHLFHDTGGDPYAAVKVGDRTAVLRVDGTEYRDLLAREYYVLTGKGANRNAIGDAVSTLSAMARFDGQEEPVHLRVAPIADGLAIDLGDSTGDAAIVTAEGWHVAPAPVRFVRPGKPAALPRPARGGDFARLWDNVNVAPGDRVLVAAWLLAALRPTGPYPIMLLVGEQGTGKSSTSRVLKRLTDPSAAPLRAPPRDVRDLLVAARNTRVLAVDNLSGTNADLSDALCRLSTGGALSERRLYTNEDEVLVELQRPIILNGIDDVATRPDLADRCLHLLLPPLATRETEADLARRFEADAPLIFGALLDALVLAQRDHEKVELSALPRMADFAKWATAGLPALGFSADEFMAAYQRNRDELMETAIDASPVASALVRFMEHRDQWTGSAVTLLSLLADGTTSPAWPKSAKGLVGTLRRLAPALRSAGIEVTHRREAARNVIDVCRVGENVPQVPQVPPARKTAGACGAYGACDVPQVPEVPAENGHAGACGACGASEPTLHGTCATGGQAIEL
jgi:hypothetical protein